MATKAEAVEASEEKAGETAVSSRRVIECRNLCR